MDIITIDQTRKWYGRYPHSPYLTAFVGISGSLARNVCKVRDELKNSDPRHVFSPSSYLHVTVKEFGWLGHDVKAEALPSVLNAVSDVARNQSQFVLSVDGLGIFPSVIYGKVGKGVDEVRRMNVAISKRLGKSVLRGRYEGKRMVPHATIVHFASTDIETLLSRAESLGRRKMGEMVVREIQVKKSYPSRLFEKVQKGIPGRINEPLATFRLGGGGGKSETVTS
jgi:2'-5' RNA ligase